MRKRVLGAIAALTAGAGGVFGQSPVQPPTGVPAPIYDPGVRPVSGPHVGGLVPPPLGGPEMMSGGPPPMLGGEPGMMMPGYPPGVPGTQPWESALGQGGGSAPRVEAGYLNTRLLLWFVKAQPANQVFATTGASRQRGLAGQNTTRLLHSERDLGYDMFTGFHINGGVFRGADRRWGFDFGGMLLEQKKNTFFVSSDRNGIPLIARPFVEATTGNPDLYTVAQQGLASGSLSVVTSHQMYGAEANLLANLYRGVRDNGVQVTINSTLGFRFLEIDEDLSVSSQQFLLGGDEPVFDGARIFAPASVQVVDTFDTLNRFYGGQVGLHANVVWGRCTFNFDGKLAIGVMNQTVDVDGRSALVDIQRQVAAQALGGVYANSLNIGRYRNDEFAVIPDIGGSIGYQWSPFFSTAIGYNFMMVNRVVRPGNSIPTQINKSLLPTFPTYGIGAVNNVPNTTLTQDEFWAQGVTFTMILKF